MLYIILAVAFLAHLIQGQSNVQCKDLVLDWDTYHGESSSDGKLCIYSNVRFAGPPTGQYRFTKPRDPSKSDPKPAPRPPISCLQVDWSQNDCLYDGTSFANATQRKFCPYDRSPATHTEDCLFLDIYAPLAVVNGNKQVPVVVWFFGGAYLFGSKHEFDLNLLPWYSGQGVLEAAPDSAIFVTGNYRVGIYGWLAGASFKKSGGTPNVGLYDQRKTLEFVQKYIHLLNGNRNKVTAWGESAGGGSIIHHLTAMNGQQDPLFSKAFLQSPAYQWGWDQQGVIEATYQDFAREYVKCTFGDLFQCLQRASTETLDTASQKLFQTKVGCNGIFPVGPSVDGVWVKTLPPVALKNGLFWKNMESLIVSHVATEVDVNNKGFMPYPVRRFKTDESFRQFIHDFAPQKDLHEVRQSIIDHYPSNLFNNDQLERTATVVRDSTFTCNTRQLFNAYHKLGRDVWMVSYNFLERYGHAVHASDILPLYVNHDTDVGALILQCDGDLVKKITGGVIGSYVKKNMAPRYQALMISHAIHGDPNVLLTGNETDRIKEWPPARDTDKLQNVLIVKDVIIPSTLSNPFKIGNDDINTRTICDFWDEKAKEIMAKYSATDGTATEMTSNSTLSIESPSPSSAHQDQSTQSFETS